jgi:hypothetical protein
MFLDDQIVEIAEKSDWNHWNTRTNVEMQIIDLVYNKLVEKSNLIKKNVFANDNDLLIEVKRVRRAFDLAISKLHKEGIHIHLTWSELVQTFFHESPLLMDKLTNI